MKQKTLSSLQKLEQQRAGVIKLYNELSSSQLQFRPDEESWNILQVMRHIVTAEAQSLIYIRRKMKDALSIPELDFKVRIRSLILKLALALPIKFKAPKIAEVQVDYPEFEQMVDEWDDIRNEYQEMILNNDGGMLSRALYKHPRVGMLNIKQAIEFMEDHVAHHQKQIDRIMAHTSFPSNEVN